MTFADTITDYPDYPDGTDPDRPIPYTLTPKALAALAEDTQ